MNRRTRKRPAVIEVLPFQCTFCTETFKTKHDWQRHEKALHLPLERWVCSLQGPGTETSNYPLQDHAEPCCMYCGKAAPDNIHMREHGFFACQERRVEERTFYRKDHLVQHLRLVHNAIFVHRTMDAWRVPMPDIKSRCGFCGISMTTWTDRIDHISDHFKAGKSMAEWQGDWGFEESILKLVEFAIPPCKNSHHAVLGLSLSHNLQLCDRPEQLRTEHALSDEGQQFHL